jgi:L-arabinonolactonase
VSASTPSDIISVANILGEGILWDSRRQVLCWTDVQASRLHRFDWSKSALQVIATPERVGSFGLVAGSEKFITAFASGIALYDVLQQSVAWLARPDSIAAGIRFNDGRVDRQGRFWSGTMVESGAASDAGCLYSVDSSGNAQCHVRGIHISNGLCFSPAGTHVYFADSPRRMISVYELREPEGLLGPPQLFVQTPKHAFPDGAAVDTDGCVWSAHWGAGCIVRYTPQGRIDRTLKVPTRQPTCVCFGGPDLDVLCVSSARDGLDAATLKAEPHAGDVFLYRTGVQGLPECEYRT